MTDTTPRISFLIPAYNEQESIIGTIQKLRGVMDATGLTYEIIVIDDGSSDGTGTQAASTGVTVITQASNKGYGRALKTGMSAAQYEWCAIVDADSSYPIEQFPLLLRHIPAFDMVVGARTKQHYWGSLGKRIGRLILLQLVRFVIGTPIPDANSGMRVFRKSIALAHAKRISSGFSFTVTLTLAMFMEDHFVHYVPIDYHKRAGKSKVKLGWDSLRVIQILAQAIIYYNPLKLFLILCFLAFGSGILLGGLAFLFENLATALIIWALTLLTSILLGGLGFIAEAIRLHRLGTQP